MKAKAVLFTAVLLSLLTAPACASEPPAADRPRSSLAAPRHETLYLGGDSVVSVVDGASGKVLRRMPAGAASPDWSRLYSVASSYSNVQLRVVDSSTGAITHALKVPAWADDARLSANGRWLALTDKPDPQEAITHFQVRDAALEAPPTDVELSGAFSFDGLSDDGQRLYLLQLRDDGSYLVRLYDLAAHRLVPGAIADKTDGSTAMSGAAVNSLTTGDGQEQLTLYERGSREQAFVHVLPVGAATEFAYCVDLPAPGIGWTLTAAPGGRRFYALNSISESVVTLTAGGLGPPQVSSGRFDPAAGSFGLVRDADAKEGGRPASAAVSADGTALFAADGGDVVEIDAARLRKRASARLDGEQVLSLAAGSSGWLYATTANGRLLRIDPASMRVSWKSRPDVGNSAILRVAG